ncbi:MAG: penicillin-binding transpeptidase domain-containing protein [Myxococcota bacterium]|nr:penicillin-binding transpeptidase domain-containing protein [Myxococcota bacterium]
MNQGRTLAKPTMFAIQFVLLHCLIGYYGLFGGDTQAQQTPRPKAVSEIIETKADRSPSTMSGQTTSAPDLGTGQPGDSAAPGVPGALDPAKIYADEGMMKADLENGWSAELTADPWLQSRITGILNRAKVPFGAAVVVRVSDGAVLGMADRYDEKHPIAPKYEKGQPTHLALRAVAPAASVFKIVTAAALIDAGLAIDKQLPFHPAKRRLSKVHLGQISNNAPRTDLGQALVKSNNGFFGRAANRYLTWDSLTEAADRFAFNRVVPFPLLTDASVAQVPRNELERARMAAGFWHSKLTPLHGALIAAAVAKDGKIPSPRFVEALRGPNGQVVQAPIRPPMSQAMSPQAATQLRRAMGRTVRQGTARRAFGKWPKKLSHINVGGKTGSLSKRNPHTSYTWFVGYAPVENPEIAVSVMVGNSELWWQKAADVARDVFATYFRGKTRSRSTSK